MAPALRCSFDVHLDGDAVVGAHVRQELVDHHLRREDLPLQVHQIDPASRRQHPHPGADLQSLRRQHLRLVESQQSLPNEGQTGRPRRCAVGSHHFVGRQDHSFRPDHPALPHVHEEAAHGRPILEAAESVDQLPSEVVHLEVAGSDDRWDSSADAVEQTGLGPQGQRLELAIQEPAQLSVRTRPQPKLARQPDVARRADEERLSDEEPVASRLEELGRGFGPARSVHSRGAIGQLDALAA